MADQGDEDEDEYDYDDDDEEDEGDSDEYGEEGEEGEEWDEEEWDEEWEEEYDEEWDEEWDEEEEEEEEEEGEGEEGEGEGEEEEAPAVDVTELAAKVAELEVTVAGLTGGGERRRRLLLSKQHKVEAKEQKKLIEKAEKYLTVHGMFELKFDQFYEPFNKTLNKDLTSWTNYVTQCRENSHGLTELNFDLSDVILMGTSDSNVAMDRTIPRFQVRLNQTKTQIDAFEACEKDEF